MATIDDLYTLESVNGSAVRDVLVRIEHLLDPTKGGGTGGAAPGSKPATFMEGLTSGPAKIIALFGALEKSLTAFGSQVAKFVAQASPITILKWNLAVADLQAVIGRALVPVLEKATAMVRKLADTFASLSPEAQKLAVGLGVGAGLGAAFAGLYAAGTAVIRVFGGIPALIGTVAAAFVGIASTMDGGKAIFKAFGAVVKALTAVVEAVAMVLVPVLEFVLVPILEEIASAAENAAEGLKAVVSALREAIGLDPLKDKSATGAAVRNAQIGDIQSFINKAYTNAYSLGDGGDPAKESAGYLKDIRDILRKGSSLVTPEDSWASTRPGLERVDRGLGGDGKIGRGIGSALDVATAPFTAGGRAGVEALRKLFG